MNPEKNLMMFTIPPLIFSFGSTYLFYMLVWICR